MSNYLSSLLTSTTRFRSLLPSSETDGDTTDDTHLCRVLRAYYTEKGRSFPAWLPPDPKTTPAALPPQNYGGAPVGAGYGGMGAQGGMGGGSKLGSLWDTPSSSQAPPQQPQSLRAGRGPAASSSLRAGLQSRGMEAQRSDESAYAPRPLPSQRDGSYQVGAGLDRGGSPASLSQVTSAGSAQDRLKARLWGAKSTSPGPGSMRNDGGAQGGQGGYSQGGTGQRSPYDSGRGGGQQGMGGGYGQGGYDSRVGQAGGQRGYR